MNNQREEIVLAFFDGETPKAIMHSNGSHTFYRLKKMTREEITNLLGAESKVS